MYYKKTILLFFFAAATLKSMAQADPNINVSPANSGVVAVGSILDLFIDVGNTGIDDIPVSKLRPIVEVASNVTFLPTAEQTLPAGWTILVNNGFQIRVCNTGTIIPGESIVNIILKVRGVNVSPPETFNGQINFGNGTTCAAGPTVAGNNTADDFATSTIAVIPGPLPLNLLSFNGALSNCKSSLNWATESEINTDRFEIERKEINNVGSGWKKVAEVAAKGTLQKSAYGYLDATLDAASVQAFYRLKMIDKDGSYTYSDVVAISVNCKTSQVVVFPNPVTNGKVSVTLSGATGITQSVLTSAAGQQVIKATLINGLNTLNVSGIADGVYYLHIKEANGTDKKVKLLIQK